MSNILILSGSKRKGGNTDTLAASFAEGAKLHNTVETISIHDYKIRPCTGCNHCFKTEEHKCKKRDDMRYVYKKLAEADVVVIASPVYFYGISSQLKSVVDRLHNPIRNSFHVKKLGLLLVGGASIPNLFDAIKLQYNMILKFFNLEDIGNVCVSGVREVGAINGNAALKDAYEMGARIE